MSNYAKIMKNDIVDGEGVCVSLWMQGCPFHCEGCHNKSTWNPDEGIPYTKETDDIILNAISENNIKRNFSVLGGEPLAEYNKNIVNDIVNKVRKKYPDIKIYLWTGYYLDELKTKNDKIINEILSNIDYLIDGRFELDKRDITLYLRGSSNQSVISLK